jgi:hypothetical protein
MTKRKSVSKKENVRYGGDIHKVFRRHLRDNMSVSSNAISVVDEQAVFLVEKIIEAAVDARKSIFKTATMNASCVKAGLGLILPEDVYLRAVEAGERAVLKLVRVLEDVRTEESNVDSATP